MAVVGTRATTLQDDSTSALTATAGSTGVATGVTATTITTTTDQPLRRDDPAVVGVTSATGTNAGGVTGATAAAITLQSGVVQSETASSGLDAAVNRAADSQKLVRTDTMDEGKTQAEVVLSDGSDAGEGGGVTGGDALSDEYETGDYTLHAQSLATAAAGGGGTSGSALLRTHGGRLHRRELQPHAHGHGALGALVTFLVVIHVLALLVWMRAWWRQRKVKSATMRPTMPPQKVNCTYDMDKPGFSMPKIELSQLTKVYKAQQA